SSTHANQPAVGAFSLVQELERLTGEFLNLVAAVFLCICLDAQECFAQRACYFGASFLLLIGCLHSRVAYVNNLPLVELILYDFYVLIDILSARKAIREL